MILCVDDINAKAPYQTEYATNKAFVDIHLPGQRYFRPGLFEEFFREVVKGRRDYENLLPMTIGIHTDKL